MGMCLKPTPQYRYLDPNPNTCLTHVLIFLSSLPPPTPAPLPSVQWFVVRIVWGYWSSYSFWVNTVHAYQAALLPVPIVLWLMMIVFVRALLCASVPVPVPVPVSVSFSVSLRHELRRRTCIPVRILKRF